MGVNRHKPHILVLPEDRRNAEIATGFNLHPAVNFNAVQVLPEAGGWARVKEKFKGGHAPEMREFPLRYMLLIIDFDNRATARFNNVKRVVPRELEDRVFILGVLSEPERLKARTGMSFECIGKSLARDCLENTRTVWGHDLLKHNENELDRLISAVRPFLFGQR